MKRFLDRGVKFKPIPAASMNLEETFRTNLHRHWGDYVAWRKKFESKGSARRVHELRIAIRKLRNTLCMTALSAAEDPARRLVKGLDDELKRLNTLRDVQTQRKDFQKKASSVAFKNSFKKHLKKMERKKQKKLEHRFKKISWKTKQEDFLAVDEGLTRLFAGISERDRNGIFTAVKIRFDKEFDKLVNEKYNVKAEDDRSFHKFRVRLRNLTYKLDDLRPLLADKPERFSNPKSLRKKLGKLQDKVTFNRLSKDFLKKIRSERHPKRRLRRNIYAMEKRLLPQIRGL